MVISNHDLKGSHSSQLIGFSALWLAPVICKWGFAQVEKLVWSSMSLYEVKYIPGSSILCKAFSRLFDGVVLGQTLNGMWVNSIGQDIEGHVGYDYWRAPCTVYVVVASPLYCSALEGGSWLMHSRIQVDLPILPPIAFIPL